MSTNYVIFSFNLKTAKYICSVTLVTIEKFLELKDEFKNFYLKLNQ